MYSDCGLMDTDFMTGLLCSCQNTARQFGAGGDFHPFRSYLNSVTMPTKRQCDYIHTIMCSQETITKSGIKCCISVLAHGGGGGGGCSHLCLDPGQVLVDTDSLKVNKVNKSAPQLHCCFVGGTSQLAHSAYRSTCKSIRALPYRYKIHCVILYTINTMQ